MRFKNLFNRKADKNLWIACGYGLACLLLASLIVSVFRNYYVKAYSDPINWLSYAVDLRERFSTSYWPVGYPFFLKLVMLFTGKYYVFLSNMPVLICLASLVGVMGKVFADENESRGISFLTGVGCFALFLGFDSSILIYLTNPYRDPLSFVLVVSSVLLLLRFVSGSGEGYGWLGLSGLLLGFSYCIRETSILIMLPMFLFGLAAWKRGAKIKFWGSALTFGICLFLGALPMLIQSQMGTGQMVLPPQAASTDTLLPGLHVSTQKSTFSDAMRYFIGNEGFLYLSGAFLGLVFALIRRNMKLLLITVPGLIIYFVFYSYYECFVRRYFYVVVVLGMPLVSYGLYSLVQLLTKVSFLRNCRKEIIAVMLTSLLALVTIFKLSRITPADERFLLGDAMGLTEKIEEAIPEGSYILTKRHLCEVLDYFTHAESTACENFCKDDVLNEGELRLAVERLLEKGIDLYVITQSRAEGLDAGAALLDRMYNLSLVYSFRTSDYNLRSGVFGAEVAEVYKLSRWNLNTVSSDVVLPVAGEHVLRVDAASIWNDQVEREYVHLLADGSMIDERVKAGANFYRIATSKNAEKFFFSLKSDKPVRSRLDYKLLTEADPLILNFGENSPVSFSRFLSKEFMLINPTRNLSVRVLKDKGSVYLPLPWRYNDSLVYATFVLRSLEKKRGGKLSLSFFDGSGSLLKRSILPADGLGHFVTFAVADSLKTNSVKVDMVVSSDQKGETGGILPIIELDMVRLQKINRTTRLEINLGRESDLPYVVEGFYNRENYHGKYPFRWTSGRAVLDLGALKASSLMNVEVYVLESPRPGSAQFPKFSLRLNGSELKFTSEKVEEHKGMTLRVARTVVDADALAGDSKLLTLEGNTWNPSDHGVSADRRDLGIMLHRVVISPVK